MREDLLRQAFEQVALLRRKRLFEDRGRFQKRVCIGKVLQAFRAAPSRIGGEAELLVQKVGAAYDTQAYGFELDLFGRIAPMSAGSSVNCTGVPSGPTQFSEW